MRAATALEEASESEDDNAFLTLATDFSNRYPTLPDGHAALAQALQRKGRFDAAIRSLDEAVRLGLDETQARMARADIYDDAGKTGKAIQELSVLTRAENPEVRQISLLQRARLLMEIGDLSQALKDTNDAINTLPDEFAYVMRGHVYRRMGDLALSLEDYSRAIQLSPESPELLETRAEVYELLERTSEAQADRLAATAATVERQPATQRSASPVQTSAHLAPEGSPAEVTEHQTRPKTGSRGAVLFLVITGILCLIVGANVGAVWVAVLGIVMVLLGVAFGLGSNR